MKASTYSQQKVKLGFLISYKCPRQIIAFILIFFRKANTGEMSTLLAFIIVLLLTSQDNFFLFEYEYVHIPYISLLVNLHTLH